MTSQSRSKQKCSGNFNAKENMQSNKNQVCVVILLFLLFFLFRQNSLCAQNNVIQPPEFSKNLSIYEVNIRQYTKEGSFKAFEKRLPELQEMGFGIIWLMPIHPVGEKNRKGSLGSYYAVKDYFAVNPEFGTMDDFKQLVQKIHELGMYVILDWVANHSAWDNPLTASHPHWYTKDARGNFIPPVKDWGDVIDLNYEQPELRQYMLRALKFWVEKTDIDGYRCDVAGMVPMDFWDAARKELDQIKPVFMLAEAEGPEFHKAAFDMTYGWDMHHALNQVAQGKHTAAWLDSLLEKEKSVYPNTAYRMQFTSNHDENSWNGTVYERLQDAAEVFAVYCATIPGMPLLYSGQEAGLDKRLKFFDKDVIEWREHKFRQIYTTLIKEKRENRLFWNGGFGAPIQKIANSAQKTIFSFIRKNDQNQALVLLNLSGQAQQFNLLKSDACSGEYKDLFSGAAVSVRPDQAFDLAAWDYLVLVK